MSINFLLSREYHRETYHCRHFAAEAWEHLTGDARLRLVDERDFHAGQMLKIFRNMRRHPGPTDAPSIVLMNAVRNDEVHIGVCLRRRLLHINEDGAQFLLVEALATMYKNMRFYS